LIVALERFAINGGCGLAVSGDLIVGADRKLSHL
jgi:enoyl-CoA hydratase/carnithine racemase